MKKNSSAHRPMTGTSFCIPRIANPDKPGDRADANPDVPPPHSNSQPAARNADLIHSGRLPSHVICLLSKAFRWFLATNKEAINRIRAIWWVREDGRGQEGQERTRRERGRDGRGQAGGGGSVGKGEGGCEKQREWETLCLRQDRSEMKWETLRKRGAKGWETLHLTEDDRKKMREGKWRECESETYLSQRHEEETVRVRPIWIRQK